uniref:AlNc14C88G5599 protein n=1 Tax=Albugo laibachii Nc14 TaxID=890382 RepID=F0WG69_9STRA|nr:AlNc14C88G5599 [Albugo laibachii Nc14]|eukprot:CCA20204.1 AlNc14C88G5599 [Albugo laibachii Nc14]
MRNTRHICISISIMVMKQNYLQTLTVKRQTDTDFKRESPSSPSSQTIGKDYLKEAFPKGFLNPPSKVKKMRTRQPSSKAFHSLKIKSLTSQIYAKGRVTKPTVTE